MTNPDIRKISACIRYFQPALIGAISLFCMSCHRNVTPVKTDMLDLSGMDTSVSPGVNFFRYANGNWLRRTRIPPSQGAWGVMFTLSDLSLQHMREILDSASQSITAPPGSPEQKVGDFYAAAMDSANIEKQGYAPIKSDLHRIAAIRNQQGILKEVVMEYQEGLSPLFSFYGSADDRNSRMNAAHFDQGGLGLPNRDYYFNSDSSTRSIREAYVQYMALLFHLTGDSATGGPFSPYQEAERVMKLETSLATVSKSPVQLRDIDSNYHKMTLKSMDQLTPGLSWQLLTRALNLKLNWVLVGQPGFYQGLAGLLSSVPISDWKNYFRFHLIDSYAPYLNDAFVRASFSFNKELTGQQQQRARWKRMCGLIDNQMGDALGQLYVKKFFPPAAKQRMLTLVSNLQQTFAQRIARSSWMTDSTKQKALVKLHAMVKKIGYPDKWKNYNTVLIYRDSLITDIKDCGHYAFLRTIRRIGKPVDRSTWYMTPPTVDAYYNPTSNDINFPAGILQPPFFFLNGDDAVNYGAIGIVIGHEMTHGFDDQGRKYDANGNLRNWWSPQDAARFRQKAAMVVKQYDGYTVLDSLHINGRLTLGENIADIGGTAIALAAFHHTPEGKSQVKVDGLTPDQRFFLSLAQIWRVKYRPAILRSMLLNNPHSPAKYRVEGPASELGAFYRAFHILPGEPMYRPDSLRVQIW